MIAAATLELFATLSAAGFVAGLTAIGAVVLPWRPAEAAETARALEAVTELPRDAVVAVAAVRVRAS